MKTLPKQLFALQLITATTVVGCLSNFVFAFSPCACCDSDYDYCSSEADEQFYRSTDSCSGFYGVNGPEQCFVEINAGNAERAFECSNCYESAWNNYQNLQQQCANDWWNCSDSCTGWGQGAVN